MSQVLISIQFLGSLCGERLGLLGMGARENENITRNITTTAAIVGWELISRERGEIF
jgi:hypothetical protein